MITLEEFAKQPSFTRKIWGIDDEPTHLDKSEYNKAWDTIMGVEYWEESDKAFRKRIQKSLKG